MVCRGDYAKRKAGVRGGGGRGGGGGGRGVWGGVGGTWENAGLSPLTSPPPPFLSESIRTPADTSLGQHSLSLSARVRYASRVNVIKTALSQCRLLC